MTIGGPRLKKVGNRCTNVYIMRQLWRWNFIFKRMISLLLGIFILLTLLRISAGAYSKQCGILS